MNGRIYDPTLGRFMSADPFIQDVTNSQNLNRYTYVNNNPLSYTDPSGYFFKKIGRFFKKVGRAIKKFWKPLVAIAAAIALQFYVLPGVSAGVGNVILTGKPKPFLTGFAQGAATFGVGSAFSKASGVVKYLGKAVAHGVVGVHLQKSTAVVLHRVS